MKVVNRLIRRATIVSAFLLVFSGTALFVVKTANTQTALDYALLGAVFNADPPAVKKLITAGANVTERYAVQSANGPQSPAAIVLIRPSPFRRLLSRLDGRSAYSDGCPLVILPVDPMSDKSGLFMVPHDLPGHLEVLRVLLEHGASTKQTDDEGADALIYAVTYMRIPEARLLLRYGADPNSTYKQEDHETALMWAARNASDTGNAELVKLLLSYGADPLRRAGDGRTALQFYSAGRTAGADLIRQASRSRTDTSRAPSPAADHGKVR